jgi:hypothetical protein
VGGSKGKRMATSGGVWNVHGAGRPVWGCGGMGAAVWLAGGCVRVCACSCGCWGDGSGFGCGLGEVEMAFGAESDVGGEAADGGGDGGEGEVLGVFVEFSLVLVIG